MSSILVIGRSGQLAQSLAHVGGRSVVCLGRPEIDLDKPGEMRRVIEAHQPDIVINAAAYTLVDLAESEPELARSRNVEGPRVLAEICGDLAIPCIHVSTDCVFDGRLDRAYRPGDVTGPLGVYGRTKLDGELAVAKALAKHLIVRVSWVFSEFGSNFVTTMLKLAETRDEVTVVDDQIGHPTYAPDIARGLLEMAKICLDPSFAGWGLYHLAGDEAIDRASMAREIYGCSARAGGRVANVIGVPTSEYKTPAERPLNARLDGEMARTVFGLPSPDWRGRVAQTVEEILKIKDAQ
ncbi:MAG: dTDP-4-dehydrorhamnose reductase [Hyphomonas sp.]